MIVENNHCLYEQEELFTNRRLSDLLPIEFIHQIGLDPNQYIFDQINFTSFFQRRNTDPGYSFIYPNKSIQRRNTTMDLTQNYLNNNSYFSVQLSDKTVNAYATNIINYTNCDGVIVLDGLILRYGKIIKHIFPPPDNIENDALRIISFDESGILDEYLSVQKQLAMILISKLIKHNNIETELIDVETVSYQSRALLKVKVSNANVNNIDALTKNIIDLFYMAVEIFS